MFFSAHSLYFGCSVTQVHVPSTGSRTRRRCDSYEDLYRHRRLSTSLSDEGADRAASSRERSHTDDPGHRAVLPLY